MQLVKVNLPTYSADPKVCPTTASQIKCDYPPYNLNKIDVDQVRQLRQPAAYSWSRASHWTNDDQNLVVEVHRRATG